MRQSSSKMAWIKALLVLWLVRRGDASPRAEDSEHDDDSWSYSDDESASNHTSASYTYGDEALVEDVCPFSINASTTAYDFVTKSATECGSVACCTFEPLTNHILTWSKMEIEPVTVGVEVVIIDKEQDLTSTITEVATTGIVATLYDEETTLNPSLWLRNGTFDGGSDVPTRTTVTTDGFDRPYTIKYPSAYVILETELFWYGSIPIVSAGATSCLQFDPDGATLGAGSTIASPTFVSTPTMTVDPTDPKGIFYTLVGEGGMQIPGGGWDADAGTGNGRGREEGDGMLCGGSLARELLESWQPTDLIVSVYSSCVCSWQPVAPAQPVHTASFLLDKTTSYGRLTPKATDLPVAGQRISNNAASETSGPKSDTNIGTALASIPTDTVRQPSTGAGEQKPSQAPNNINTKADAGLLQNTGPRSTRTLESLVISNPTPSVSPDMPSNPTPSVSPDMPSTPVKDTGNASPSASKSDAASSRMPLSIEKSMAPPPSSPEGSRGPSPSTQSTIKPQSIRTQSETVVSAQSESLETASLPEKSISPPSPIPEDSTGTAMSSQRTTTPQGAQNDPLTVNSQCEESASFRTASSPEQSGQSLPSSSEASVDIAPSSQRTTESPSVLVKPVPASSQSAATSSDAPAAAVIVANGQLSMVSVESSIQSGPLSQSSLVRVGDMIASGIGETEKASAIETSSQESATTEASPTTRTAADTKTSSPTNTASPPSRASEFSQTRSSTSQKSTSRAIAPPTRTSSSLQSSETTRATGDIIASVMGMTRSTGFATRLGSERWTCFAVGLLIFYLAI